MTTTLIQLPWKQADWFARVTAWIEQQLAQRSTCLTAPIELLHQRPWSSFARVPTDQGLLYFKAPAPMFTFEVPLMQWLAHWRPDCNVPVVAIEETEGWILSADAGTTLRQLDRSPTQVPHWCKVLPLYSELQIAAAEQVPTLLAMGVPDRRLAVLPDQYANLLEATAALRIGLELGLTAEEYERLRAGQADFAEQCEALAAYQLPQTLTHEEIHENNVLLGDSGYVFTDWSDCSISHPFFTMLVTLRATAYWLGLDEHGPEMQQLRDAYLEPWTAYAPRTALDEALALAYHLGMVNRALSWHHGQGQLSEEENRDYLDSVPGWLQDYLAVE